MAVSANLGFPRLGLKREWKKAGERYWKGKIDRNELVTTANELTARHWKMQQDAGIDVIPCNDFAFYDLMLDTAVLVGAVPERYGDFSESEIDIDTHFAMARGRQDETTDVIAMEMTKWFDTNYHYIVPEFTHGMTFRLASTHPFNAVKRAREAGIQNPRPVLIGPATFLLLGKAVDDNVDYTALMESLVEVYVEVLEKLADMDVDWVQIDEPTLTLDLTDADKALFEKAYARLKGLEKRPKLMVTTYFGSITHTLDLAVSLGDGLHVDLVRAPEQLDAVLEAIGEDQALSLGVVNGRNVWRNNLDNSLTLLKKAADRLGEERLQVAPSCSLLHSPIDLDEETDLDPTIRQWMAFGKQKLHELHVLTQTFNGKVLQVQQDLVQARTALAMREASPVVHNQDVQQRMKDLTDDMARRATPFSERKKVQQAKLGLPELPTTTIGSFPQTREIRRLRVDLRKGRITLEEYERELEKATIDTIRFQEEIGLDVLVHGEFERNDMVEYFGQQLDGYVFTKNGWVQSYGSRGVKPPIIFGDVSRKGPMSVRWSKFAKDQTDKPMKGMLTGPVTMLQWSFVRDDQPRSVTAEQLALVIRDEVVDLEKAGIDMIQIDEPAIREGLPLLKKDWAAYFDWAIRCFRISAGGVQDETQIHTHMCYSEFNDMMDAIAAMDADVISIEASRSRMELLDVFDQSDDVYPNDIGPGVYDIHSPRVPSKEEMVELLHLALKHVPREQLWVNPDCGLKTRGWEETRPALTNMVDAAKEVRAAL